MNRTALVPTTLAAVVRFSILVALCDPANCATPRPPKDTFDVIPPDWISQNGPQPGLQYPKDSAARIFPSLLGPNDAAASVPDFTDDLFFTNENDFPRRPCDQPQCFGNENAGEIEIDVSRGKFNEVRITIGPKSVARVRLLSLGDFRKLQNRFREWLLAKSGSCFFCNRADRFWDLDKKLKEFWIGHVLRDGTFEKFAAAFLNVPREFNAKYIGSNVCLKTVQMNAIPLSLHEDLSITWGATAVYPFPNGTGNWVSRPMVGGQTRLPIVGQRNGLALFQPGTAQLSAEPTSIQQTSTGAILPFDPQWAGLFGTIFIPIYNLLDLHADTLLKYFDGQSIVDGRAPHFIFLLAPLHYLKADAGQVNQLSQHTSDARVPPGVDACEAIQLSRAFLLIGLESGDQRAVNSEFTRLLDAAVIGAPSPTAKGWVAGVFGNQTFAEGRRHIAINGRYLEESWARRATWGSVVGSVLVPVLMEGGTLPRPVLEVFRTILGEPSGPDAGRPIRRLRFRFYRADESSLDTAEIAQGDEFNAGNYISEAVR